MRNSALKKEQVRENIIYRILSGQYPLKGRIPPERELCEIMHVSRITVRAAVDCLVQEGILERDGRRGTLIKKIPRHSTAHDKKPKRVLFIYFSSITGHLVDQHGVSARLYHGIEQFANEHGLALMIQSGENFVNHSAKHHDSSIAGIIAGGSQLEKRLPLLVDLGIPVVAVDALPHGLDIDAVCGDNYEAGVRAAEKIVARDYKNPLLLVVKYENEGFIQPSFLARQRGFIDFPCNRKIEKHLHILDYKDLFNNGHSVSRLCALIKEKNVDCIIDCADVTCSSLRGIDDVAALPKIIVGGLQSQVSTGKKAEWISFDTERIGYLAAKRLSERMQNPCMEIIRLLVPVKKTEH